MDEEMLRQSVAAGVDAIVAADCAPAPTVALRVAEARGWSRALASRGYLLLLPDRGGGPAQAAPPPSLPRRTTAR